MPRITGTTNAQSAFLRALRRNPDGPPPEQWPDALRLRRWMRKSTFRRALASLLETYRLQTELQLRAAGAVAARAVQVDLTRKTAVDASPEQYPAVNSLIALLRLAHLKTARTVMPDPPPPPIYANNRRRARQRADEAARAREKAERDREAYEEWADKQITRRIDESKGAVDIPALCAEYGIEYDPSLDDPDDPLDDDDTDYDDADTVSDPPPRAPGA